MSEENTEEQLQSDSTTAENLMAWKALLSSEEAKDFVGSVMEKAVILFGQTPSAKIINTSMTLALMVVAFGCVGLLGYYQLVPEGTVGVLAGIIVGYFFKKNE